MRAVNRMLSAVLAVCLAAVGAVITVEIVLAALHDPYWVLPWPRWHRWALEHSWTTASLGVTLWALGALGLLVLVLALLRHRPVAIAAEPYSPDVAASIRRGSLERSLQRAARGIDGIGGAGVTVSRHKVRVKAQANRRDVEGLKEAILQVVGGRLTALHLAEAPDVKIRVNPRRK